MKHFKTSILLIQFLFNILNKNINLKIKYIFKSIYFYIKKNNK